MNSSKKKKRKKKKKTKEKEGPGFFPSAVLNDEPKQKGRLESVEEDYDCQEHGEGCEQKGQDKKEFRPGHLEENNRCPANEETPPIAIIEQPDDSFNFDDELTTTAEKESHNFLRIVKLMYGVGLRTLRNVFKSIHPKWTNKSSDALNLDKGKMILNPYELASFNTGDIDKWDISLMTTVLLYSKKCSNTFRNNAGSDALHRIKDYKNTLLSHANSGTISEGELQKYWPVICASFKTLGASSEEMRDIYEDDIFQTGENYRDLFLEELSSQNIVVNEVRQMQRKLDTVIANQGTSASKTIIPRGAPNCDEWTTFCQSVNNFDHLQNNFILVTDAISSEKLQHYSILRSVVWKMVLDFDSSSEIEGMYKDFASKEGKNILLSMITPDEIRRQNIVSLARHIDANKTQWMFVNGRVSDKAANCGPKTLDGWECSSIKEITKFFGCCSEPDKFDKHKPIICLVLPFRKETVPFINVTLKRLVENFNDFKLNFVGLNQEQCLSLPKNIKMREPDLSSELFQLGMENLFHVLSEQCYRMPTSQANVTKNLTQKEYLFLNEYLVILYKGCEDLPFASDPDGKEKLDNLIKEHRESFMSGNLISFLSLFYNHDAKREIGNDVRQRIQRLLDQELTHTTIVEISHSPGTGGSTIARRVLWDLHKSYPCVIAKLEDHVYDLEDDSNFINNLADRISCVQEMCHKTPAVLLDGKHTRIEALSNRLARELNTKGKRAVLLKCTHNSEDRSDKGFSDSTDVVHTRFSVNVKLEESKADLHEFQEKYKDYITEIKSVPCLSLRVFHFPLMAMLEGFRTKLQQIIFESFENMSFLEKEMLINVAFIQKYAAQSVPAPLLYEAYQKYVQPSSTYEVATYEDIRKIITENLWNLMMPANPAKFISRGKFSRVNHFPDRYTLQHPVVAELVLQKAKIDLKRDMFDITRDFLNLPIYDDERFMPLTKDLLVFYGNGQGGFSLLFKELKLQNLEKAGELFCDAAHKTRDVSVVTSAARFHAKAQPPSFTKAKELIAEAFKCRNAKEKCKTIYDVKGVVLLKEMNHLAKCRQIQSLRHLEELAIDVLKSFRSARTFPPNFPNPLIGEVKTWLACIQWISKNHCDNDSNKTFEFIPSNEAPPFFRTCISESFHLLNIVDDIVKSASNLSNPDKTQREANNSRLSLMSTMPFKTSKSTSKRMKKFDVIQACRTLCSSQKFPTSSQTELKRLQVQYICSSKTPFENLDKRCVEVLFDLLRELVENNKELTFAKLLIEICLHVTGPKHFSLEQGLAVSKMWIMDPVSNFDPMPHFYEMIIYFLKIIDGHSLQCRAKYQNALRNCIEKSHHNCKKTMSTHYIGKTGEGMSHIMTRSTLFNSADPEYTANSKSKKTEAFWRTNSRKTLRECRGRIKTRTSGGKTRLIIELLQGNIELYVAKNAGIGEADRDFVPGSMIYFVVSFNLLGPVANGITLEPSSTP